MSYPGDIYEDHNGLTITTPHGPWHITDEDALALTAGLIGTVYSRLTRPWDADDTSTILTRGRNTNNQKENN